MHGQIIQKKVYFLTVKQQWNDKKGNNIIIDSTLYLMRGRLTGRKVQLQSVFKGI